jgi:hypothetical protein
MKFEPFEFFSQVFTITKKIIFHSWQLFVNLARLNSSTHKISCVTEKAIFGGELDPQFSGNGGLT